MSGGAKPDYDTRIYPICAPWRGQRGDSYVRVFLPAFLNGLEGQTDDFASLLDHVNGVDPGGVNGPAHPAGADGAKSTMAYKNRAAKVKSLLYRHVDSPAVRAAIELNCQAVQAAVTAHATALADHAAAVAAASRGRAPAAPAEPPLPLGAPWGTSIGQMAKLTVDHYGTLPQTGLANNTRNLMWASLNLRQVGINSESMINLKMLIDQTNTERPTPMRFSDEECRIKFLSLITVPPPLVDRATAEMQTSTFTVGGIADYNSTVNGLDELWRSYYARGDIKPSPAANPGVQSNRVDAHEAELEANDEEEGYAFAVIPSVGKVSICWKCHGLGHFKSACPSKQRYSVQTVIAALQGLANRQRDGDARGRFMARRGKGRGRGGRGNANNNTFQVDCDEEGRIFDPTTGTLLGSIANEVPADEAGTETDETEAATQQSTPAAEAVAVEETMVYSAENMFHIMEEDELLGSNLEAEQSQSDDERETEVAMHASKKALFVSSCGAAMSLLMMLMQLSRATRAIFGTGYRVVLLTLLVLFVAYGLTETIPRPEVKLGESASTLLANELKSSGASKSPYCNVDSGTTRCASGRRSNFPTAAISNHRPNLYIRVASGARLPVAFIGVMVLKVKALAAVVDTLNASQTQKELYMKLGVVDALYVPGMPTITTLVSTKSLFRRQGVRTYLNDELKLQLPNGMVIPIRETDVGYFLNIDSAYDATNAQPADYYVPSNAQLRCAQPSNASPPAVNALAQSSPPSSDLIHQRLCHFSFERIRSSASCTTGLRLDNVVRADPCRSCQRGGGAKHSTPPVTRQKQFTRFGQRISSDLCKMPKSTPFGFENMLPFYDQATKTLALYYTRGSTAEEVRACFLQFEADYKEDLLWCGGHVLEWHTDNGGEFVSDKTDEFLAALGTRLTTTVPWNPQMNPAERAHGIVLRPLRIILASADCTVRVWPFVASQIQHVHNSLASRSETATMPGHSPYEMRSSRLPDLSVFRVLLCRMLVTVRAERDIQARGKLAPRTLECVHLGWDAKRKGYFGYCEELQRLSTFKTSECMFFENEFPRLSWITGSMLSESGITPLKSAAQQEAEATAYRRELETTMRQRPMPPPVELDGDQTDREPVHVDNPSPDNSDLPIADDGPPSSRTRSRLNAHEGSLVTWGYSPYSLPLTWICIDGDSSAHELLSFNVMTATLGVPATYYDALQTPEADLWREALHTHMAGKMANNTCVFVPRPDGVQVVKSKLVMDLKYNVEDNTIRERRVRWVGCGYSQVKGVDYDETFTATAKSTSVRVFLCMLLNLNLFGYKTDIPKAFTRAELDTRTYVEQPEEKKLPGLLCPKVDRLGRPYVALLKKALEGLKQAGYLFQKLNTDALINRLGFKRLEIEPTLFIRHSGDGMILILVWVDDFAIGASSNEIFKSFVAEYKEVEGLDIREEGELRTFVGLEIYRQKNSITITQEKGIERAVCKYFPEAVGLKQLSTPASYDSKSRTTSLSLCDLNSRSEDSAKLSTVECNSKPSYVSMVATALYFSCMTRADCMYCTTFLCRFMSSPNRYCYQAAIELVSYLYHSRRMCLTFQREGWNIPRSIQSHGSLLENVKNQHGIHVMPDAAWKIHGTGMNMTYAGHLIFMNGAAVDWGCKQIKVICHSSSEAEIVAACFAGKRAQFIRNLLTELAQLGAGQKIDKPFLFLIDNSACDELTRNVGVSKRTEHFLRWQHYMRWLVFHKYAIVCWVRSSEETADIMTKVLGRDDFLRHRDTILNNQKASKLGFA